MKNFRALLNLFEDKDFAMPDKMCEAIDIDPMSLAAALEGMVDRGRRAHGLTFDEVRSVLAWGVALGYSYAKKQQRDEDEKLTTTKPVIVERVQ